jgi:hypothetical protein
MWRRKAHGGIAPADAASSRAKRCDQPGKVLIQLESLILAQSERWRQA